MEDTKTVKVEITAETIEALKKEFKREIRFLRWYPILLYVLISLFNVLWSLLK